MRLPIASVFVDTVPWSKLNVPVTAPVFAVAESPVRDPTDEERIERNVHTMPIQIDNIIAGSGTGPAMGDAEHKVGRVCGARPCPESSMCRLPGKLHQGLRPCVRYATDANNPIVAPDVKRVGIDVVATATEVYRGRER